MAIFLGASGAGGGTITVDDNHIFATTVDRDNYFVANPNELTEGLYCVVSGQLYEYRSAAWVDITAVIQGPAGADGVTSVNDDPYGVSWDGDTAQAPSRNTLYDKIETIPDATDALASLHGIFDDIETLITINADPTKFDVAAFDYYIDGVKYSFAGQTGVASGFAPGDNFLIVNVDATGLVLLSKDLFNTPTSLLSAIELGGLGTDDGTNISFVGQSHFDRDTLDRDTYRWAKFAKGTDYIGTAGAINASVTALQLGVSGGSLVDPEMKLETITGEANISARPYYHVAGVWDFQPTVTPLVVSDTQYDNGTDLVNISNNKWVSHNIIRSARTNTIYYVPSQADYATRADAIDAPVSLGGFEGQIGTDVSPLAKIIVQQGTGVIDTVIDVRNQATNVVSASTSTLQTTYDRSGQPSIKTTVSGGAVSFEGGTGTDTDNVLEGKNNAGTTTFAVQADGVVNANDMILAGDLTVNGTTTTINSQTLDVEDKNVTIGDVTTPSDITADGGGITLKGTTDKTVTWQNSDDSWHFNQGIVIDSGSLTTNGNVGVKTTSVNYGSLVVNSTSDTGKTLVGDNYQAVPTTEDVGSIYTNSAGINLQAYNNGYKDIILGPSGGNVCIGASDPNALLEARKGSIGTYTILSGDDVDGARGLVFSSSSTTNTGDTHTINAQSATGELSLETGGTEAVRIDTDQKVQATRDRSNTIGDVAFAINPSDSTAQYGFRLDQVNNNLNLDNVSAGTSVMSFSNDKVGIGTGAKALQAKLHLDYGATGLTSATDVFKTEFAAQVGPSTTTAVAKITLGANNVGPTQVAAGSMDFNINPGSIGPTSLDRIYRFIGEDDARTVTIKDGDVLIGTTADLPNATADHKLQTAGFVLHERGWRDNIAPFTFPGTGGSAPSEVTDGAGARVLSFGENDEITVIFHVDHDYALGTDAYPHIHWSPTTTMTAGQTVIWEFSYTIAKGHQQGQSLTGTPTVITITHTADGTEVAGEHMVTECSDLDAFDLLEPDTIVKAVVTRGNGTYNSAVHGYQADLHYLSDREVTIGKRPDFNVAD